MTGAGSATVAFAKESSFLGSLVDSDSDGTPEYYRPGRNPVVQDAELSRQLERMREDGLVEAADSLAGNLEGAFAIEYVMSGDTHSHIRDIVFNDAGTGFTNGASASSRWYLGVDHLNGTTERVCKGTIPLDYEIQYQQGSAIRETLTMGFADEEKNTSKTPSSIVGPTDGQDVPFHGASLSVDAATVTKLQSATLSISNIARFQRGAAGPVALDAVIAAPETTLDAQAIYGGSSRLEQAYGASDATSPQATMNNVAGSLSFSVAGATVATYDLPKLKPDTYNWDSLIDADNDLTDPISYHVNGGISVS